MINRPLDKSLGELKHQLIVMAGLVEEAVEAATRAWRERDRSAIEQVYAIEDKVNTIHVELDALCLKILATQGPLAAELRLILAILKINSDMERMVDQTVNIVNNAEFYLKFAPLEETKYLVEMAEAARFMVREAIDAFVNSDDLLAHNVLKCDAKVDNYKDKIFRDVLTNMKAHPQNIEQGLNIILIARNLERIGDHATNVAEDVIFTVSGEDIRHPTKVHSVKTTKK